MKALKQICSLFLIGFAFMAMSLNAKAENKTVVVRDQAELRAALNNTDSSVDVLTVQLDRMIDVGTLGSSCDTLTVKSAATKGKIILDLNGYGIRFKGTATDGVAMEVKANLDIISSAEKIGAFYMYGATTDKITLFKLSDKGYTMTVDRCQCMAIDNTTVQTSANIFDISGGTLILYGGEFYNNCANGGSVIYSHFTNEGGIRISNGDLRCVHTKNQYVIDDSSSTSSNHAIRIVNASLYSPNKYFIYSKYLYCDSSVSLKVDGNSKNISNYKNSSGVYVVNGGYSAVFSGTLEPVISQNLNATKELNAGGVIRISLVIDNPGDVADIQWYVKTPNSRSWSEITPSNDGNSVYNFGSASCDENGTQYCAAIEMKDGTTYESNVTTLTVKHSASSKYEYDENGHWNPCRGCDAYVYNLNDHDMQTYVIREATATATGTKGYKCSVCGYISNTTFRYSLETKILEQPSNVTASAGETVSFCVKAQGTNITYQWQKSTNNGETWANCSGTTATTDTLRLTAKTSFNNMVFRCVISAMGIPVVSSDTVKLTVKSQAPVIVGQPLNKSVKVGENVTFSVKANGDNLTYQWQKSTDGGKSWANCSSASAKTSSMNLVAKSSYHNWKFRCVVTNSYGSVTSNAAVMTVASSATAGPVISTQPKSQSVVTGTAVKFTVAATSSNLKYQWKISKDGGKTWANSGSTGATTATLSMTAKLAFNGYQFKCVVTDGNGNSTTSSAATLTVTASTGSSTVFTVQPKSQSVVTGTAVKFIAVASNSNVKYQWKISKDGGKTWANSGSAGATTATLSMTAKLAFNGYQFKCIVTTSNGQVIESNVATLTVTAN